MSNLAVLLSSQKPLTVEYFNEARKYFKQAISGREAGSGPDHPSTLYTVSNLGKLLSGAPAPSLELFEEAEVLHNRAVDKLTEKLHKTHPLTLTAMHNQGCHWLAMIEFNSNQSDGAIDQLLLAKCLETLQDAHKFRTEKLGKQHPETLLTEQAIVKCNLIRGVGRVYESWQDLSLAEFAEPNTHGTFFEMRQRVRAYGVDKVLAELVQSGYVNAATGNLTVGMQPFNIFARLAAGVQTQPSMIKEQAKLGRFQKKFLLACNRPEAEDHWYSTEPAWLGKASMSQRHRFLVIRNLHWEWFNVLTFGFVSGLHEALRVLRDMKEAALLWVRAQTDWSEQVGLFLHVHSHSSVLSLHLHIVDMSCLGPTWDHLKYKNLSIDDAIAVLETEVQDGTEVSL